MPNIPSSPIQRKIAGSCWPVRSTSLARGASSCSQNSRIICRSATCSGDRVKSMVHLGLNLQPAVLKNVSRDREALYLVGPAQHPQRAHVTIYARDGILVAKAVAAVHLQHLVGGVLSHAR